MPITLTRKNEFFIELSGTPPGGIYASEAIKIEKSALDELETIVSLDQLYNEIHHLYPDFFGDQKPEFNALCLSPDFHKGQGVPIGTSLLSSGVAVPAMMGSDIGCGMQFIATDIPSGELPQVKNKLITELRQIFFEGRRDLPLFNNEVEHIFSQGLANVNQLVESHPGSLWEMLKGRDLSPIDFQVSDFASRVFGPLADFKGISRSAHFGSIGGGNHFVEFQSVDQIFEFGQVNKGCLALMVHSGSLSMGKAAILDIKDRLKSIYPTKSTKPEGDFYPLPLSDKVATGKLKKEIFSLIANALNFAAVNRVILGLMAEKALNNCGLKGKFTIIHDSAHNLLESASANGQEIIHRKGATRASLGRPLIIPGSMGSASYLLRGLGNTEALESAPHGAGRAVSRQESQRDKSDDFEVFLKANTVVTPVDFEMLRRQKRWDILREKLRELKQEAPKAYKDIEETIRVTEGALIAAKAAKMSPLLTVKQN